MNNQKFPIGLKLIDKYSREWIISSFHHYTISKDSYLEYYVVKYKNKVGDIKGKDIPNYYKYDLNAFYTEKLLKVLDII